MRSGPSRPKYLARAAQNALRACYGCSSRDDSKCADPSLRSAAIIDDMFATPLAASHCFTCPKLSAGELSYPSESFLDIVAVWGFCRPIFGQVLATPTLSNGTIFAYP